MQYVILLLISITLLSCQQELDVKGFWVGVDEDGQWNHQTIEVTTDSIFIYDHFGMSLKSTYLISGSKIRSGTTYQLFSNERFNQGGEVEIAISEDTLFWRLPPTPDKYVRSLFDSYVVHHANSKGLQIDLPISDTHRHLKLNSITYADLFIGYDQNNEIKFGVNDILLDSLNSLTQWMYQESDRFDTTPVLRLFIDKSIPSVYMDSIKQIMRQTSIYFLQKVSKPSSRRLLNRWENPYSAQFYGNIEQINKEPSNLTVGLEE